MSSAAGSPLLLDTHYWIWLQMGAKEHFTAPILKAIERAAGRGNLLLSVISVWELGMLEAKGRIRLTSTCDQWVKKALEMPGLTVAPLTPEIALDSTRLPEPFHGDPADRMIVATARAYSARLVTRDAKLIAYGRRNHVAIL